MMSLIRKSLTFTAIALVLAAGVASMAGAGDGAVGSRSTGSVRGEAAEPSAFFGTVVNLSCSFVRPSGGGARCDTGEHYFALQVGGTHDLYPLLVSSGATGAQRLRDGNLTGKQVRVTGVASATGGIVVTEIALLDEDA